MYYYIRGELTYLDAAIAVLDVGGIGFRLSVSANTLGTLTGKIGETVKLYTYLSIKEDSQELYAFATEEESNVFKMLISVSGVGTKSAIAILSLLSPERFVRAVSLGDTKTLSSAPGIGAKTAARIVLELKEKVGKLFPVQSDTTLDLPSDETLVDEDDFREAARALTVLGYSRAEAAYGLRGADRSLSLEDLIRYALARLMKG